jgi:arylsulfatase A-like enzyme
MTKVGFPGSDIGLRAEDPTMATALKAEGYATGQFGKNHFGDLDEFLPSMHGFDEFSQQYVAQMLQTLAGFPARQEPAAFNIDRVLEKLEAGMMSA